MGKYMKKSKTTRDIGVMEISEPTSLGVRTRAAKTLALKRLNSSDSPATNHEDSALAGGSSCYLQLRSRRLEKPPPSLGQPRHHKSGIEESGSRSRADSVNSFTAAASCSVPVARSCKRDECFGNTQGNAVSEEVSFGENSLDFESIYSTRESRPCNFVEDIVTPGSMGTTKDYTSDQDSKVPTTSELEEFFAYAEKQQQRLFMEKYNFDIVNDMPLTGRYEWVQVTP